MLSNLRAGGCGLLWLAMVLLGAAGTARGSTAEARQDAESIDLTELSLEELLDVEIVSASKRSQKSSKAPASVTVLTAGDFRTYGWRSVSDALRSVRSFYASTDRLYTFTGVRGFQRPGDYNSRILVLIDGYRTNDNIYDAGNVDDVLALDVELIERLEIIRGPGSSVHGGNALFAVINIVTRSGRDAAGLQAAVEAGSFDTYRGRLVFGDSFANGASLLLSASILDSQGPSLRFPDDPVSAGQSFDDTDDSKVGRFFGKLEYGGWRLSLGHANRDKGFTGGLYQTLIDPRNQSSDKFTFVDATYGQTTGRVNWSARLAHTEYQLDASYIYDDGSGTGGNVQLFDVAEGAWLNGELRGDAEVGRHRLVAGVEYQDNYRQDQGSFAATEVYLDDQRSGSRLGVFMQDDFSLSEALTLSLGLRYDSYSEDSGQVNPRVGVIYRQSAQSVWKLLYATAFRPANVFEKYYSFPDLQVANPALEAETIETIELVFETALGADTFLVATAYRYKIDDLIDFVSDEEELQVFQNLSNVSVSGGELELQRRFANGASIRMSYGLQIAEDTDGADLSNSPEHLLKLNAAIPLFGERARLGWETQYTGSRQSALGKLSSNTLSNLNLTTARPWAGWDFSAGLYNAFDKSYSDIADLEPPRYQLEMNGRTWRLAASYSF